MKSAALPDLLPQWTKFVVTDLSGRDPLGLARVAASITDYLLPGIVVATDRARYYALYSWILWNIRETESPSSDSAFAEAFQRRESPIAIATVLLDAAASPVGKRAVTKELEKSDTDIRTGFKVLPSHQLGGYGQYYAGSLYTLGLTHRPQGEFDQITENRGKRLAEAIEKTIRSTEWVTKRAFLKRRNTLQVLKSSAPQLSLDAICQSFTGHERLALTEMFFGFDADEIAVPSLRRLSLARLLNLVSAYAKSSIPLKEGGILEDQLLLGPAYFGTLINPKGKAGPSYVPPSFLSLCNNKWRQFCLHEIISWATESILGAVLWTLSEGPAGGSTFDEVVDSLAGKDLVRVVRTPAGVGAPTPQALLASVGVRTIPNSESCAKARSKFSLRTPFNESALMRADTTRPVEILGQALSCFSLLYAKWRDGSDDAAWLEVRSMVGRELAAATILPHLDSWHNKNSNWTTSIRALIELVLSQHDRVMYEKGRLEACWVHREGDRLVHDQDYPSAFPAHNSRHRSALGILSDLGLVRQAKDGRYGPTGDGDRVFSRVKGLVS